MIWQELVFTVGGFAFAILLMPTLFYPDSSVPRTTSVPTAVILLAFAVTFVTMGLFYSAFANALTASAWGAISLWRAPCVLKEELEDEKLDEPDEVQGLLTGGDDE